MRRAAIGGRRPELSVVFYNHDYMSTHLCHGLDTNTIPELEMASLLLFMFLVHQCGVS